MTGQELVTLLADDAVKREVQRALNLPSEPVAEALRALIDAQARTDIAIEKLAAAQERTDAAVKELAVEVKELSAEVKALSVEVTGLAAAQGRTDAAVKELAVEVKGLARIGIETRKAVGALSDNVGFSLEELAAIVLPAVLEREAGVHVAGFERRFVRTDEGEEELDLFADGTRPSGHVFVVGEVKSRIYRGEVERFSNKALRVAKQLTDPIVAVMFGFVVHPSAHEAAKRLDVRLVASRPAA